MSVPPFAPFRSYAPSPSPDHLLDNPDDPRFKIPALPVKRVDPAAEAMISLAASKKRPVEQVSPREKKRSKPLTPPYPDLQPPKDPSQNGEYLKKVMLNTLWENEQKAAELLVDCKKLSEENRRFVEFTKTDRFQQIFGAGKNSKK